MTWPSSFNEPPHTSRQRVHPWCCYLRKTSLGDSAHGKLPRKCRSPINKYETAVPVARGRDTTLPNRPRRCQQFQTIITVQAGIQFTTTKLQYLRAHIWRRHSTATWLGHARTHRTTRRPRCPCWSSCPRRCACTCAAAGTGSASS